MDDVETTGRLARQGAGRSTGASTDTRAVADPRDAVSLPAL